MIKKYLALVIMAASIFACNSSDKKKTAVTDIEVANAFVRGLLDNNFNEAEQYLLKDEINTQIFERFKDQYSHKDKATLEEYKKAYIKVNETSYVTDSIFIFNYSNSYSLKDKTVLKLVRINNKWLVDLKYTFSGNL
jgi:spore germination protein GerM